MGGKTKLPQPNPILHPISFADNRSTIELSPPFLLPNPSPSPPFPFPKSHTIASSFPSPLHCRHLAASRAATMHCCFLRRRQAPSPANRHHAPLKLCRRHAPLAPASHYHHALQIYHITPPRSSPVPTLLQGSLCRGEI